ncbi:hypothetical protein A2962_01430 [Candidatus Woesebacteria bacterium RIFCSPLOWO2_01_FULL_39_61]|uniref:Uncharacterized protein n=1 Tax=Candidatus Woesebacteria bacterium RIFCSPHIGHO2_02_FULL_39_13 TaxID=1802505 RepID=A0A1F7Z4X9_9BACT|nr:MAG: hypothetical protein A2692_01670 [Candidatus Woesebacteria bacterium RIFCSPHIGHO2_01_FULL_39_95]OGM34511.1 MAG: hypothetical protein A3D01_03125 [Candidatus Woesebacteria bacterium RIFCSPHIGHO2_02_FULL_39_13]OGM38778.1 MAG: hypothetical protein A3E13_01015 [Candidatus Woesebacteria bacterium RIFCSPHIGHO2_12_FULL_40_20]OGM65784.1 MAG: hypothetical protein A2962_01430 [Candidatus Woesebacteria bacterium RIFCSPLOWO2_01_FULL_39_61]OGM73857.1 MAG: hypothetical protein A3H19_04275 [Candidatus
MEVDNYNQPVNPSKSLIQSQSTFRSLIKNQKGSILIILGVLFLVTVIGVVGYLLATKSNLLPTKLSNKSIPSNFDTTSSQPTASSLDKGTLFDKLTANTWCNKDDISGKSMLAPTAKNYAFTKNGTYKWSHFSDYPEGSGQGNWNFEASGSDSGVIFLSSGDAWGFVIKSDRISLAGERLGKCEAITDSGNTYTADNLPRVNTSDLFNKLTAKKWKKTNDLDLFRLPTEIEFLKDGKYVANFNNGECSQAGLWSLREGQTHREEPVKDCDFRSKGENYSINSEVKLDGDLLVFESSLYAPTEYPSEQGLIWSDLRYSNKIVMKIKYKRPIKSGVSNVFDIELTNVSKENAVLKSLSISQTPYKRTNDGFTTDGEVKVLATENFQNIDLTSGQSRELTKNITFTGSGESELKINVNFEGKTQPYNGYESYVLKL